MSKTPPDSQTTARQAVIEAARSMVYDGMSEAGWHRIKRAILALEKIEADNKIPVDVSA
jgi:hypothetical protein